MNNKLYDVLKYTFLTFLSLEVIYFIAKSSFNFPLVAALTLLFTILYVINKFSLIRKIFFNDKAFTLNRNTNKSKDI